MRRVAQDCDPKTYMYMASGRKDARIGHFSPGEHRCGEASRTLEGKPAPNITKQSHPMRSRYKANTHEGKNLV